MLKVLVAMMVLDYAWLSATKKMYGDMVFAVQRKHMSVNVGAAILCYMILYLGVVCISVPLAQSKAVDRTERAFAWGAALGGLVYAVFNLTNLAIFDEYSWIVGLVDTLWGSFLLGLVTWIGVVSSK